MWEDNLSNTLRFGRTMANLSDIRGYPVIFGDAVVAVSYGGKIVVIDKNTGNRKWQQEISSAETPWVAGNTVYVLNSDHQLVALNIISGEILWIAEIPKYKNPEKRKEIVSWTGPVMAGNRLLVFGSSGKVIEYNPASGEVVTQWDHKSAIYLPPVVANGALYILDNNARLSAYR